MLTTSFKTVDSARTSWKRRPGTRLALAVVGLLVTTLLVGAAWAGEEAPRSPAPAPHDEARQVVDLLDEDVTLAIERRLLLDPDVAAGRIDVKTVDGVAILEGRLDNFLAERIAVETARSIRGVRSVVNLLEVVPPLRTDVALLHDVRAALAYDLAVDANEVEVRVEKGVVELTGEVDSFTESRLAARATAGVRGVRDVENRLTIGTSVDRPDSEIADDVRARLAASVWIGDRDLRVDVEQGAVRVTGAVQSAEERRRSLDAAWVTGVRDVDVSGVEVRPQTSPSLRRGARQGGSRWGDEDVVRAVEAALGYDPRVEGVGLDVRARAGTVTLRGNVESFAAKRAAEEDAHNTVGVERVRNHLRVRPETSPTDEQIQQAVDEALLRDAIVSDRGVEVKVLNGQVHLFGTLNTMWERARVIDAAAAAPGVVGVEAHLEVHPRISLRMDRDLAIEVRELLWWDPLLDGEAIDVTVSGGVVTLRGAVASWAEARRAIERARQAGAVHVVDRLEIVALTPAPRRDPGS